MSILCACVVLAVGALPEVPTTAGRLILRTSQETRRGVGIQFRREALSGELLIVDVIKNSPAHQKGVQVGDIITEMSRKKSEWGEPLPKPEKVSTRGLAPDQVLQFILGQPGTTIRLVIRREGVEKPIAFDIERWGSEFETVFGHRRKEDADWDFPIDPASKIGYVRLSSFSRNTSRDLELAVEELRGRGVEALVLDLRNNPGGLLDIAWKVSSLFIADGPIVTIRPRDPTHEARFEARRPKAVFDWRIARLADGRIEPRCPGASFDLPMACLVNGNSKSASEIVAAALQDYKRAKVFGERTVGKGSVQNLETIEVIDPKSGETKRGKIKYTTAIFIRPNGKSIDRFTAGEGDDWGVTPDEVVELTDRERRDLAEYQRAAETILPKGKARSSKFEDRQLDAALAYLRGRIEKPSK